MPVRVPCPHCRASLNVPDVHLGKSVRCRRCNGVFQAAPPDAILDALPVDEPPRAAPLLQPRRPSVRHADDEEDRSHVAWVVGGAVAGVLLLAVTGVLLWVVHASDEAGDPPAQFVDDRVQGLDWFVVPQDPVGEEAFAPQPHVRMEIQPFNPDPPPNILVFAHPILPGLVAGSVGLMGDPSGHGPWLAAAGVVFGRPPELFGPLPNVELPPRVPGQPGFAPGPPP